MRDDMLWIDMILIRGTIYAKSLKYIVFQAYFNPQVMHIGVLRYFLGSGILLSC